MVTMKESSIGTTFIGSEGTMIKIIQGGLECTYYEKYRGLMSAESGLLIDNPNMNKDIIHEELIDLTQLFRKRGLVVKKDAHQSLIPILGAVERMMMTQILFPVLRYYFTEYHFYNSETPFIPKETFEAVYPDGKSYSNLTDYDVAFRIISAIDERKTSIPF